MYNLKDVYPFNLAIKILGNEEMAEKIYLPGIDDILDSLTSKEKSILLSRYRDNLTLYECGREYGVSGERIRQIEVKAIRKLRHPSRVSMVMSVKLRELEYLISNNHDQHGISTHAADIIQDLISHGWGLDVIEFIKILDTPVKKLNIRRTGALIWANIYTLGDIINKTESELINTKGVGETTIFEIKSCLKEFDLTLAPEYQSIPTSKSDRTLIINKLTPGLSLDAVLNMHISQLNLSTRSFNYLIRSRIEWVGDLVTLTEAELRNIRNIGIKSADEIIACITSYGLMLKK